MKKTKALAGLLAMLCLQPAQAEDETWCLVTNKEVVIAMSDVACLAAADDESTFSVVLTSGNVVTGVARATFEKRIPTGIRKTTDDPIRVGRDMSLEGVSPDTPVRVYDTEGKLRQKGTARYVSLASLPAGIYIIQVNNTSFKVKK